MLLSDLLKHVDSNGKAYQNWFKDVKPHYLPLLKQVYTKPEDQEFLLNSRRVNVLFKYWAIKKVTNLDEAKAATPLCRYCHQELAMPRCVEPKREKEEWMVSCRNTQCSKKYVYEKTRIGVFDKYQYDNISSDPKLKEWRSKHMTEYYQTEAGKISNAKRAQTVQKTYGDEYINVSQLPNVKKSKENSFLAHYGVTNIFKRIDLMKEYWKAALGVEFSIWNSEVHINQAYNSVQSKVNNIEIGGTVFGILHESEGELLKNLSLRINPKYMSANKFIFEKKIDGKSRLTVIDIEIYNQYFIELKSGLYFYDLDYLDEKLNIISGQLLPHQRYIVYLRLGDDGDHILVVKPDGEMTLNTTDTNLDKCYNYFGHNIIDQIKQPKTNMVNGDMALINSIVRKLPEDVLLKTFLPNNANMSLNINY